MIQLRKQHPAFTSRDLEWIPCAQQAVLAYLRRSYTDQVAIIQNLADHLISIDVNLESSSSEAIDLLTGRVFGLYDGRLKIVLQPYEYLWVV